MHASICSDILQSENGGLSTWEPAGGGFWWEVITISIFGLVF